MKQYILLFSLFVALFQVSYAQDDAASALKQINTIKVDVDTYLSAESTSSQWEEAYDNAKALLEIKIEEWAREKSKNEDLTGCFAKAENSILEIKARRGNLYRAFLYVKKSDIMTYSVEKELVVIPIDNIFNETNTEVTVQHTAPETVTVHVPEQMKEDSHSAYQPSAKEKQMLGVSCFDDIQMFIKAHSSVGNFGKHASMPSNGDYYVFIYNREGGISAYLHHLTEGYINVKTGKEDNLSNYKGCGAFWFRFN